MQKFFNNYSRKYRNKIQSEINVTPFVDVMLVLLVIFMLTSQAITSGFEYRFATFYRKFFRKK